jgi:formyltetrahydrofolate deformylase
MSTREASVAVAQPPHSLPKKVYALMSVVPFLLTFSCLNQPGIMARVTTELFAHGGDILEAHQFDDHETGRLFARLIFSLPAGRETGAPISSVQALAAKLNMDWSIRPRDERQKVLLLVSKSDHCLVDMLYRWRIGELKMDVVGIVSNHPRETHSSLDFGNVPFHYLPVTEETKPQQEEQIKSLVRLTGSKLVILARYMQILSDDLAEFLMGRCINIHHGFLPGFKGAKPYHQAHHRGVKLIGATAHYVTTDLDDGPIIEQDVERISHQESPNDLVCKGRDIERRVLARAVAFHLEGRSHINGNKTVVFRP